MICSISAGLVIRVKNDVHFYCSRCYDRTTQGSTYSEFKICSRNICWWRRSWVPSAPASVTWTSALSRTWSLCSLKHSCCRNDWSRWTKTMSREWITRAALHVVGSQIRSPIVRQTGTILKKRQQTGSSNITRLCHRWVSLKYSC